MKCLFPPCQNEGGTRGLCPKCYVMASIVVSFGMRTWDQLERRGKVRPPKHPGAGPRPEQPRALRKWLLEK